MSQRIFFSLRYYNQIFLKYGKVALTLVFFLTLIRLNLFFLSVNPHLGSTDFADVYMSLFTGIRFDLLVYGFFLIPVVLVNLTQALSIQWFPQTEVALKLWLSFTWLASMLLNWIDFFVFTPSGLRARWQDFESFFSGSVLDHVLTVTSSEMWLFSFIIVLMSALGLYVIWKMSLGHWKDTYSPNKGTFFEAAFRVILPIFLVALAARGTLEPVHLEYQHSMVSNEKRLNEMALNPMWCLDKNK